MPTIPSVSRRTQPLVAILWGAGCEEATTAIFVSQLRQAGVPVKLIGMGGQPMAGQFGLKLVSDLPINRAMRLVQRLACLVIPCYSEGVRHFFYDPYVVAFLQAVQQQGVTVIVAEGVDLQAIDEALPGPLSQVLSYPEEAALFAFVQQLAEGLLSG